MTWARRTRRSPSRTTSMSTRSPRCGRRQSIVRRRHLGRHRFGYPASGMIYKLVAHREPPASGYRWRSHPPRRRPSAAARSRCAPSKAAARSPRRSTSKTPRRTKAAPCWRPTSSTARPTSPVSAPPASRRPGSTTARRSPNSTPAPSAWAAASPRSPLWSSRRDGRDRKGPAACTAISGGGARHAPQRRRRAKITGRCRVLLLEVLEDAFRAALAAQAALLGAAEGRSRVADHPAVDADHAHIHPEREAECVRLGAEDVADQAVDGVVRHPQRILGVVEHDDRRDRAEDLLNRCSSRARRRRAASPVERTAIDCRAAQLQGRALRERQC